MREELMIAIEDMEHYMRNGDMPIRLDGKLQQVLAAAQAYFCGECGGSGMKSMAADRRSCPYIVCPACKADRELADGGEVK